MKKIIIVLIGILAIACSDDEAFKDRVRVELPIHYQNEMSKAFPLFQTSCKVTDEIKKKSESSYTTEVTCRVQTLEEEIIQNSTEVLIVREGKKDFIFKSI